METTITIQNRELSTRVKNKKQINMKKFYLLAAAATIITACTNNEKMTADLDNDGQVLIGFETYHEKSTKATGEITAPNHLTEDNGGFGVWGYKGAPEKVIPADANTHYVNVSTDDFTSVFSNVKVWYEDDNTKTQGFTYTVPKYWDKGSEYIFFAYAPYDESATTDLTDNSKKVYLDKTKGTITIKDIPSIQDISKYSYTVENSTADIDKKYDGVNAAGLTDYLMATYVPEQSLKAKNTTSSDAYGTNQNVSGKSYEGKEQTVGFTFGHMLSKFQVKLQAKEEYSGVQSIDVSYLAIVNMPEVETDKAEFTQTSPTAAAGTYSPDNWDGKTLQIINTDATVVGDKAKNANATSKNTLYILKNGAGKDSNGHETTNADDIASIVDPQSQPQIFNYYVAPSKADKSTTTDDIETYKLNIKYTITYIDGTTEVVTPATIDLSTSTTPLTEFLQNNSYILTINVGLNQIYFTVDAVEVWTDVDEKTIEIQ